MVNRRGPDPTVEDIKFLYEIHMDYKPALGTTEISDKVGMSQQAASKRLKKLEAARLVESDKIGNARVWWLTDAGRAQLTSDENEFSNQ